MADYRIEIGSQAFGHDNIIMGSITINTAVDIAGSELSADIFSVGILFEAGVAYLFSPADYDGILTEDLYLFGAADVTVGDLDQIPYGTPIKLYDGTTLVSKFFVHDVTKTGKNKFTVNAISAVGMLEAIRHNGGVYVNTTAAAVISDIIGGAFPYTINAAVAAQIVAGWLPIASARDNLHQLCFALGINIVKDQNGDIVFTFLLSESPISVPDDRIFMGGNVQYNVLASAVEVAEHQFYKVSSTQAEQIFSNAGEIASEHLFIEFPSPCYDVYADNLTIEELGDNYCIVSGIGSLYGKKYTHETKIYQRSIPGSTAIVPNVLSSSSCTLINHLNVISVLDRLVAYYGSRKTISADLLVAGEKAGDTITFTDAFGDETTGIITAMDTVATNIRKAKVEIVSDYSPTGQGNHYDHVALITASGTWKVPAGVTKICIGLIGGGNGGYGGYNGQDGAGGVNRPPMGETGDQSWEEVDSGEHTWYANQPLKKGGAGGNPGSPGKSYVINAIVAPREVITVAIGSGGSGGVRNGGTGAAGTATTASSASLGNISSDLGIAADNGFMDVFTGQVFAAAGKTGTPGGDGGQTDVESLRGDNGVAGRPGANVGAKTGGAGGAGKMITGYPFGSGGGGGGAAVGTNGGNGGDATLIEQETATVYIARVITGAGGNGANAVAPRKAYYGCGGDGGNGGGAGGNAGAGRLGNMGPYDSLVVSSGGTGGKGSSGGAGGDGCVIIYW